MLSAQNLMRLSLDFYLCVNICIVNDWSMNSGGKLSGSVLHISNLGACTIPGFPNLL